MQPSYLDEPVPIVALATPPGESALAVIRAYGPGALGLAAACFSDPERLLRAPGYGLVHGFVVDPSTGEAIDEVLAAVFRPDRGPTGEEGVELSCHGSPAVVRRVLEALGAAGFRAALPGEFSFRAFLHGKTDLVRAEAVQELVRAPSEGARAEALRRLEGGLSRRVGAARRGLVELLAEAEARLDHGEEDGAPAEALDGAALRALRDRLAELAAGYAAGKLYRDGARVVVAGRPNAGKSRLFNLLVREERSIVSPEPGTTRDWIEARIELAGMPVILMDTAGLREAEGPVEGEGVARSRRLAAEAEAVVYLVDGLVGLDPSDESFFASRPDSLRIWNKADAAGCGAAPAGFLRLSAATGEGFPAFAEALAARLAPSFGRCAAAAAPGAAAAPRLEVHIAGERQKALLDRAVLALDAALEGLSSALALDALALDLREAADALGEMTGEIASAEVLEAVFSRFCIGK